MIGILFSELLLHPIFSLFYWDVTFHFLLEPKVGYASFMPLPDLSFHLYIPTRTKEVNESACSLTRHVVSMYVGG